MKNKRASKIKVEKIIFRETSDSPFTWSKLKNIEFEDDDEIIVAYQEPYYSENNSSDGYYFAEITRMVEETDEEFSERQAIIAIEEKNLKDMRRKAYEKLKLEFENEK